MTEFQHTYWGTSLLNTMGFQETQTEGSKKKDRDQDKQKTDLGEFKTVQGEHKPLKPTIIHLLRNETTLHP